MVYSESSCGTEVVRMELDAGSRLVYNIMYSQGYACTPANEKCTVPLLPMHFITPSFNTEFPLGRIDSHGICMVLRLPTFLCILIAWALVCQPDVI